MLRNCFSHEAADLDRDKKSPSAQHATDEIYAPFLSEGISHGTLNRRDQELARKEMSEIHTLCWDRSVL
jgi:hypothetical protein